MELPSGNRIRMVTAPYFLATKLVAFDGRGNGDYMVSQDVEDIIAVLDGRPEIVDEVAGAEMVLREYLAGRFAGLLGNNDFTAVVPGHLPDTTSSPARLPLVMERINRIAELR